MRNTLGPVAHLYRLSYRYSCTCTVKMAADRDVKPPFRSSATVIVKKSES